jgi:pimeloyl-ACP methyl ester carboxylesterase
MIGWSIGSVIASRFALEAPERVDRHVLIAPGLFVDEPLALRLLRRTPFAKQVLEALAGGFIAYLPINHLTNPSLTPDYGARMHEQRRFPGLGSVFASAVLNYEFGEREEYREVGHHPRPVLVLWGDRDSPTTPYANAKRVLEYYPRARLVTFAGARHAPHIDPLHAARASAEVVAFLGEATNG